MNIRKIVLLLVCGLALSACNSGGKGNNGSAHSDENESVPETPTQTEFSAYVTDMIQHTDDSAEPAELAPETLSFNDDENEAAFDALL